MKTQEGKYDAEAENVLRQTDASVVLLSVMGGNKGNGFSVAVRPPEMGPAIQKAMPTLLRNLANLIESQSNN